MTEQYTPTTAEVREAYQGTGDGLDFKRRYAERGEEFDRWLEKHKGAPLDSPSGDAQVTVARLEASIRLGISAEEGWDGPSVKPGDLTDAQVGWLDAWMAGEGWVRA